MAKGNSKKKPTPKNKDVEVSKAPEAIVKDKKVEKVIEKLEEKAPVKKEVKVPSVEDQIMEAKAYLTEASEMLMNLAIRLEKEGKSGDRFRGSSKDIEYMNRNRIIV